MLFLYFRRLNEKVILNYEISGKGAGTISIGGRSFETESLLAALGFYIYL